MAVVTRIEPDHQVVAPGGLVEGRGEVGGRDGGHRHRPLCLAAVPIAHRQSRITSDEMIMKLPGGRAPTGASPTLFRTAVDRPKCFASKENTAPLSGHLEFRSGS